LRADIESDSAIDGDEQVGKVLFSANLRGAHEASVRNGRRCDGWGRRGKRVASLNAAAPDHGQRDRETGQAFEREPSCSA
jgi:hypothetical protein